MNPSKHSLTVMAQVFKLIPRNLIPKLAKEYGVSKKSRSFTPTSHVLALMFGQLSHAISLNDICDCLRNHSGALSSMREAVAPSRNTLSNANRVRNADMAEALFWSVLAELKRICPSFAAQGRQYCGIPRRFKRVINVVDSSTIKLMANCLDWAKHRRRKAAAKMHLRLDLHSFLPAYVLVKSASTNDLAQSYEVCADVRAGEIVVFDKAYVGYEHLYSLTDRGVFWVTRVKENTKYEVVGQHSEPRGEIIRDVYIKLTDRKSSRKYPVALRMVEATVEVDGKPKQMAFLTNNMQWAPSSICDLYRSRWGIEVFFKEIKQTLQIADFMGYNENAVRWQIWIALLVYVLLRFVAWQGRWKHTFTRLFTILRGVLWSCVDLFSVLDCCGTAHGAMRIRAAPEQCYLPGFSSS
ncbi:MAG: IS4 family transposase [Armatimonadetes bacterium]|nr:IS4 family transposase [Armatimonadota bacterium]